MDIENKVVIYLSWFPSHNFFINKVDIGMTSTQDSAPKIIKIQF